MTFSLSPPKPKTPTSARCDIGHHVFEYVDDIPACENCGRAHCKEHAGASLEEPPWSGKRLCTICQTAYTTDGLKGLQEARLTPLRTHGS